MNIYEYTYNKYFTHHVALFKSRYLFLKDTSERCCLSRSPRISPMYEYQRLANTIHISDVRAQIAHLYRTSDEAATHPPIYADVFFVYRHLRQSNIFAGRLMRQHTTHTHTRNFILFMLAFWVLLYLYAQQQKKTPVSWIARARNVATTSALCYVFTRLLWSRHSLVYPFVC